MSDGNLHENMAVHGFRKSALWLFNYGHIRFDQNSIK
jgi:hypothetical protein